MDMSMLFLDNNMELLTFPYEGFLVLKVIYYFNNYFNINNFNICELNLRIIKLNLYILKKRYFGDLGFWDWAQSPISINNIFKKIKNKIN